MYSWGLDSDLANKHWHISHTGPLSWANRYKIRWTLRVTGIHSSVTFLGIQLKFNSHRPFHSLLLHTTSSRKHSIMFTSYCTSYLYLCVYLWAYTEREREKERKEAARVYLKKSWTITRRWKGLKELRIEAELGDNSVRSSFQTHVVIWSIVNYKISIFLLIDLPSHISSPWNPPLPFWFCIFISAQASATTGDLLLTSLSIPRVNSELGNHGNWTTPLFLAKNTLMMFCRTFSLMTALWHAVLWYRSTTTSRERSAKGT